MNPYVVTEPLPWENVAFTEVPDSRIAFPFWCEDEHPTAKLTLCVVVEPTSGQKLFSVNDGRGADVRDVSGTLQLQTWNEDFHAFWLMWQKRTNTVEHWDVIERDCDIPNKTTTYDRHGNETHVYHLNRLNTWLQRYASPVESTQYRYVKNATWKCKQDNP